MPLKSSHLRQVSNGDSIQHGIEGAVQDAVRDPISVLTEVPEPPSPITCTLGIHDEAFSKLDVLVNSSKFPSCDLSPGTRLRVVSLDVDSPRHTLKHYGSASHGAGTGRRMSTKHQDKPARISYVFVVEETPPELLVKHPALEISISQKIALALGFKARSQVVVTKVTAPTQSPA